MTVTRGWGRLLVASLGGVLLAACGGVTPPPPPPPPHAAGSGRADDLLVVDCLLPGQVRQLGSRVTYLTARRAVKTAARDCQIRGGEYTAFDRADHATALRVWLPLAEQGDVAAQTYVGEIFEKGLGVAPDHAAAAGWYRRAAEAGNARAAVNLGSLYERGLGVARDSVQALAWYRRAAGVGDLGFAIAGPSAEVEQLRAEVAELRRELRAKQGELERTRRELDLLRRALEQRRGEVETERAELARLREALGASRRQLEAGQQREAASVARVRELEQSIAERETRLTEKDRDVARLREAVGRLETDFRAQRERVDQLRQQAAAAGPSIELIEPELIAVRGGLPRAQVDGDRLVVIGRVGVAGELRSLTVNSREEALRANSVFKTEVPVAGAEQRVQIVAVDTQGRRAALEFAVVGRVAQRAPSMAGLPGVGYPRPGRDIAFGTYYALVIGNNDYRLLPPLKTAVNDAREVARVLEAEYGFRVRLLLNASRYELLSALNELRERLTDRDNLLIYYAGHGELDERNQRGHWLPIDAEPQSSANWISNIAVTDVLNTMTVRQLLVVADSCYAGTMTRSALGRLEGGLSDAERLRLMQAMARQRSRMAMTSGGVEPVLDGAGGPHSIFAQTFIELLRSNVGVLPGQDLFHLLRLRVASAADRVDMRQVPEYAPIKYAGHESGDFFFVRAGN